MNDFLFLIPWLSIGMHGNKWHPSEHSLRSKTTRSDVKYGIYSVDFILCHRGSCLELMHGCCTWCCPRTPTLGPKQSESHLKSLWWSQLLDKLWAQLLQVKHKLCNCPLACVRISWEGFAGQPACYLEHNMHCPWTHAGSLLFPLYPARDLGPYLSPLPCFTAYVWGPWPLTSACLTWSTIPTHKLEHCPSWWLPFSGGAAFFELWVKRLPLLPSVTHPAQDPDSPATLPSVLPLCWSHPHSVKAQTPSWHLQLASCDPTSTTLQVESVSEFRPS